MTLWSENFFFLILLAYTVHWRLCNYVLYKSTIDSDIDIVCGSIDNRKTCSVLSKVDDFATFKKVESSSKKIYLSK